MARVLFVVPPLTGHTNPTVAVGAELASRGHDVAWCGYGDFLRDLLPADAVVLEVAATLPDDLVTAIDEQARGLRGAEALKFLFETFLVPLARHMVPGVEAAVDTFQPDVLVVDQQALAGAVVARDRGLRWATSATTSAELVDPFTLLPKLREWRDGLLVALQRDHGVPAAEATAERIRFSDDLVLAFTTLALVGDGPFPPHYAFVGPAFGGRPSTDGFPWGWLDESVPCVLVSLGTVNAEVGERFYGVVVEALGGEQLQVVLAAPPELVAGPTAGAGRVEVAPNVLVQPWVPQLALLPHIDAVVSHGGHNTVCETLAHGVPLVVAPIRDDQPVVAEQVERSGAGRRVKFARVRPAELRAAVADVLADPSFAEAARRIQESFTAAGGAPAAADHLEKLAVG